MAHHPLLQDLLTAKQEQNTAALADYRRLVEVLGRGEDPLNGDPRQGEERTAAAREYVVEVLDLAGKRVEDLAADVRQIERRHELARLVADAAAAEKEAEEITARVRGLDAELARQQQQHAQQVGLLNQQLAALAERRRAGRDARKELEATPTEAVARELSAHQTSGAELARMRIRCRAALERLRPECVRAQERLAEMDRQIPMGSREDRQEKADAAEHLRRLTQQIEEVTAEQQRLEQEWESHTARERELRSRLVSVE